MKEFIRMIVESATSIIFGLVVLSSNAQELYGYANAASITNEATAATGWTGTAIMTSDASDPYHGSYSLKIASIDDPQGQRGSYSFIAVVGETYMVSTLAKPRSTGTSAPSFTNWSGFSGTSTVVITNPVWTKYNFTLPTI
ncbi:hypothetical protein QSE00_23060 [Arenibacter sp. M-2]|uniref:hypothetical protein n=1 Tax=Arenibacter sp. M-2 TaxID=3053612 RepID=UPI00256FB27D|nr:hypothetical protein [Arenibacter sp. M-2]MDL5514709.1 hypothetical protein [Arenibacter sp. M-2]